MPNKERFQNPTCNDTINLRLFTYNSNNLKDVQLVEKVEIYILDPENKTESNPDGRRLVQTFAGSSVVKEDTGRYLLQVNLTDPLYTIGSYLDIWTVQFEGGECAKATIDQPFRVYPDLWFTTPTPPVHDFNFSFRPNRMVKGTKRYLLIQITPNVPRGGDILPYYENLAIVSEIRVSIEFACGDCVPQEKDLRLVVDRQLVDYREKLYGYFFLDTTEYEPGIYNVWFELALGENVYISEKSQLQIYE